MNREMNGIAPILAVRDLRTYFATDAGVLRAVDNVSFDLYPGETFGIVGESGSGKSVTCRSLIGLLPTSARTTGSVHYDGRELVGLSSRVMQGLRGAHISMIFQDPMSALNPVMKVGDQIAEALEAHGKAGRAGRRATATTRTNSAAGCVSASSSPSPSPAAPGFSWPTSRRPPST